MFVAPPLTANLWFAPDLGTKSAGVTRTVDIGAVALRNETALGAADLTAPGIDRRCRKMR